MKNERLNEERKRRLQGEDQPSLQRKLALQGASADGIDTMHPSRRIKMSTG